VTMKTMMMTSRYQLCLVLALFLLPVAYAQKKKADRLYDKSEYYRAIPRYEKASKKGDNAQKQESFIRLADCYRLLKDYKRSEDCYKQALALGNNVPAETHYYYGNVLKTNANYTEAMNQYTAYLQSKPADKTAENAIKSCREIKHW
jgi:tetratricopeptide (TPR) repeat protein